MAATVQEVAEGIVARLEANISDLRGYDEIPDNFTPPVAMAFLNSVPSYHGAEQGGLPIYEMRVTVIVDNLSNRTAFEKLNAYLSYGGDDSLRKAIESDKTLEGVAQTLVVDRAENVGGVEIGQARYLAADLIVTVYA